MNPYRIRDMISCYRVTHQFLLIHSTFYNRSYSIILIVKVKIKIIDLYNLLI